MRQQLVREEQRRTGTVTKKVLDRGTPRGKYCALDRLSLFQGESQSRTPSVMLSKGSSRCVDGERLPRSLRPLSKKFKKKGGGVNSYRT